MFIYIKHILNITHVVHEGYKENNKITVIKIIYFVFIYELLG